MPITTHFQMPDVRLMSNDLLAATRDLFVGSERAADVAGLRRCEKELERRAKLRADAVIADRQEDVINAWIDSAHS